MDREARGINFVYQIIVSHKPIDFRIWRVFNTYIIANPRVTTRASSNEEFISKDVHLFDIIRKAGDTAERLELWDKTILFFAPYPLEFRSDFPAPDPTPSSISRLLLYIFFNYEDEARLWRDKFIEIRENKGRQLIRLAIQYRIPLNHLLPKHPIAWILPNLEYLFLEEPWAIWDLPEDYEKSLEELWHKVSQYLLGGGYER